MVVILHDPVQSAASASLSAGTGLSWSWLYSNSSAFRSPPAISRIIQKPPDAPVRKHACQNLHFAVPSGVSFRIALRRSQRPQSGKPADFCYYYTGITENLQFFPCYFAY
jgi:hypothetical protein